MQNNDINKNINRDKDLLNDNLTVADLKGNWWNPFQTNKGRIIKRYILLKTRNISFIIYYIFLFSFSAYTV